MKLFLWLLKIRDIKIHTESISFMGWPWLNCDALWDAQG